MKREINLNSVLDKYVIVVVGEENKVVYKIDDEKIFSYRIAGKRNAVLSNKTFMTLKQANKGIVYLDTCSFKYEFRAIKVSDLKEVNSEGYNNLISDIKDYNWDISFLKQIETERKNILLREYKELKAKAMKLVENSYIHSIEEGEYGVFKITLS